MNQRWGHLRSHWVLVLEPEREVFCALESECLLGTDFRALGEDQGVDGAGSSLWCGRGGIRCLDIMYADILYFDIFGLELPAKTRTMQSGTYKNKILWSEKEDRNSYLERRLRLR